MSARKISEPKNIQARRQFTDGYELSLSDTDSFKSFSFRPNFVKKLNINRSSTDGCSSPTCVPASPQSTSSQQSTSQGNLRNSNSISPSPSKNGSDGRNYLDRKSETNEEKIKIGRTLETAAESLLKNEFLQEAQFLESEGKKAKKDNKGCKRCKEDDKYWIQVLELHAKENATNAGAGDFNMFPDKARPVAEEKQLDELLKTLRNQERHYAQEEGLARRVLLNYNDSYFLEQHTNLVTANDVDSEQVNFFNLIEQNLHFSI